MIIGLVVVVRCAFGSTPWPGVGIGIIAVLVRADLDSSRDTGEDRRGVEYGIEEGSWVLCSLYQYLVGMRNRGRADLCRVSAVR